MSDKDTGQKVETDASKNVDGEGPKAAKVADTEAKTYRVTNKQLGARGIETAAHGLVMVQPTTPNAEGTTVVTLTKDEADRAKLVGLELKAAKNGISLEHTSDLPADRYINPDHPDAAKIAEAVHANAEKAAKHAAEGNAKGANLNKPVGEKD